VKHWAAIVIVILTGVLLCRAAIELPAEPVPNERSRSHPTPRATEPATKAKFSSPLPPAGSATNAAPRLTVSLTDGSRVIGTSDTKTLVLHSDALGKLEIPVSRIRTLKFDRDHQAVTLTLMTGDTLKGTLTPEQIAMRTAFGPVSLPFAKITQATVEPVGFADNVAAGLVAYYPFHGDVEDHSGNKNHGKLVGAEFAGNALRFRGDNSTDVIVPQSDSLEPTEGLTVALWVKGVPGQEAGHGWGVVLNKAGPCGPGYLLRGGGVTRFDVSGPNPCNGPAVTSVGFRQFSETRWQHITGTYSPAEGVVKTYQDGELLDQAPRREPLAHSGNLYIGGSLDSSDYGGFRGLISEVRIYNRVLSAEEIRTLSTREPSGP